MAPSPPLGPYPYPAPPYAPPSEERPSRHVSAKLAVGPAYEQIYDVSVYSVDITAAIGAQRGISGWYGEIEALVGRTNHSLAAEQFWAGASWEGKVDRVHLGVGLHLGFLGFRRATTGDLMSGIGLGAFGFVTVDLYQSDAGHALSLGARLTANALDGNATLWGPSAMLGWRY